MGIELPPELAGVAEQAGVRWPEADEEAMAKQAQAWREAATGMSTVTTEADTTVRGGLSAVHGDTGTAATQHWQTFVEPDSGHLTSTVRGMNAAADRLEHASQQVGAAKVEIVRNLVSLAQNSDAAQSAAAAGHPTALAGLDTAIRGTSANVANIESNLVSAVQPATGVDMAGVRDPVNANPGTHGPVTTLLSDTTGLVDRTTHGATDLVTNTTSGATDLVGNSGHGHPLAETARATTDLVGNTTQGATNLVGNTAQGATNLVADTSQGAANLVDPGGAGHGHPLAETVRGTTDLVGNTAHGATNLVGDPGQGHPVAVHGATDVVANTAHGATDLVGNTAHGATHPAPGHVIGDPEITGPVPIDSFVDDRPTPPTGQTVQAGFADVPAASPAANLPPAAPIVGGAPAPGVNPGAPNLPGFGGGPAFGGAPAPGGVVGGVGGTVGGPVGGAVGGAAPGARPAPGALPAEGALRPTAPGTGAPGTGAPGAMGRGITGAAPGTAAPAPGAPGTGAPGGAGRGAAPGALGGPAPGVPGALNPGAPGPLNPGAFNPAAAPGQRPVDSLLNTGKGYPAGAIPAGLQAAPVKERDEALAMFWVHMFPIGHMPVADDRPARQLPAPPPELDYAPGLRFPPGDHPQANLVDSAERRAALRAGVPPLEPNEAGEAPAGLTDGYDPLGGENERDWDRRYLVRFGSVTAHGISRDGVEFAWPPGEQYPEGGSADGEAEVLDADTEIDRFGRWEGRVFAAAGTPFAQRALPPAHLEIGYRRYRVLRPLPVWRAVSAAWFAQPGGGLRYRTTHSTQELIALGYLADITREDT